MTPVVPPMTNFDLDGELDDEPDDDDEDDEDGDDEDSDEQDDDEEEPETWQVHAGRRRHAKARPSLDFRF
jgi:hypothetical protein